MNQQLNEETGRWWAMCLLKTMNCLNDFVVMGCRFRLTGSTAYNKSIGGAVLHLALMRFS